MIAWCAPKCVAPTGPSPTAGDWLVQVEPPAVVNLSRPPARGVNPLPHGSEAVRRASTGWRTHGTAIAQEFG